MFAILVKSSDTPTSFRVYSAPMKAPQYSTLLAFVLLVCLAFHVDAKCHSQLPSPGDSQQPRPRQTVEEQPSRDPRGTPQSPLVIQVQPAPKTHQEAAQEQTKEERDSSAHRLNIVAVVAAIGIGVLQFFMIGAQVWIAGRQNRIIERQNAIMEGQASSEAASAATAIQAVNAAERTTTTMQRIERAYVTMSHYPPGFEVSTTETTSTQDSVPKRDMSIRIKVQNCGNTPATITSAVMIHFLNVAAPDRPPFDKDDKGLGGRAFLVKNGTLDLRTDTFVTASEWEQVIAGKVRLWIAGQVDYIDAFGVHHRHGYARYCRIPPGAPRDGVRVQGQVVTLELDFETRPGYNYDRQRDKGEGDDWDKPVE